MGKQNQQGDRQQQQPRMAAAPEISIISIAGILVANQTQPMPVTSDQESRLNVRVQAINMAPGSVVLALFWNGAAPGVDDFKQMGSWLRPTTAADEFEGSVPLAQLGFFDAPAPNTLYAVIFDPTGAGAIVIQDQFNIGAKLPENATVSIAVDARHSMWFSYAPYQFDAASSYGEKEDGTAQTDQNYRCVYRPQMLAVPAGATKAKVSLEPKDWSHGTQSSAFTAGPMGTATISALATPTYRTAALGSDGIADEAQHLAALLFMWDVAGHANLRHFDPLIAYSIAPITILCVERELKVLGTAPRLFFAAHDSFEWSNNGNRQHLTVQWLKT